MCINTFTINGKGVAPADLGHHGRMDKRINTLVLGAWLAHSARCAPSCAPVALHGGGHGGHGAGHGGAN